MSYFPTGDVSVDKRVAAATQKIQGDPKIALLAQLNRFAGKEVKISACPPRKYVGAKFDVNGALDHRAVTAAWLIYEARWSCAPQSLDVALGTQQRDLLKHDYSYQLMIKVVANIEAVARTIAAVGDLAGLAPAEVGIVDIDPNLRPKGLPTSVIVSLGVAAIGALILLRSKS